MFSPSHQQRKEAQNLLIATAFCNMVTADFNNLTAEILSAGEYHYDEIYCRGMLKAFYKVPDDGILRNPDHLHLLHGKRYKSTSSKATSNSRFNEALQKMTLEAGYPYGKDSLSGAQYELQSMEHIFLHDTKFLHYAHPLSMIPEQEKKYLVNTLLNYFSAAPIQENFFINEATFIKSRTTLPIATFDCFYSNNEFSFKKFMAYKRFMPVEDYLTGANKHADSFRYLNISGIYTYIPGCHILQLKAEGNNPVKYKCNSLNKYTEQSADLPSLEHALFLDFLNAL